MDVISTLKNKKEKVMMLLWYKNCKISNPINHINHFIRKLNSFKADRLISPNTKKKKYKFNKKNM